MAFHELDSDFALLNRGLIPVVLLGFLAAGVMYWIERNSEQKVKVEVRDYSDLYDHLATVLASIKDKQTAANALAELDACDSRCRDLPKNRSNVSLAEVEAWNHPSETMKAATARFQREYMRVALNPETGPIITPKLVAIRAVDPPGIFPADDRRCDR